MTSDSQPHIDHEPPAAALARAQRWVRMLTYRQLRAWETTSFVEPTPDELERAGAPAGWTPPWHAAGPHDSEAGRQIAVRARWGSRY